MERDFIRGFSPEEEVRVRTHFNRLLPHLEPNKFVIVGGLAIRYYLDTLNIDHPKRSFNDLDLIAESATVVLPSITKDFLINHYHPQVNDNFYVVLVDPVSRTKVDIFDYSHPPQATIDVMFATHTLKMRSLEDQLVVTVVDMQKVHQGLVVDPKQFLEADLLSRVADMDLANSYWSRKGLQDSYGSLTEAMRRARAIIVKQPDLLKEKPFYKDQPHRCVDCQEISGYPITPMAEIYKVLGYIE